MKKKKAHMGARVVAWMAILGIIFSALIPVVYGILSGVSETSSQEVNLEDLPEDIRRQIEEQVASEEWNISVQWNESDQVIEDTHE